MTKKVNKTGITLQSGGDATPKGFKEKTRALFENYVKSDQMEKDFKDLKSSDRLQFIQKMMQYLVPKDSEAVNKMIEEAEKRRRDEDVKRHRSMYNYDEYPDDFYLTGDEEKDKAYLEEFYADLRKKEQIVADKEREWKERDSRIRAACECASDGSNERLKKMFDSYANSKLFAHDFDKLNSTERIKFAQETASYFMQKKDLEYFKEKIRKEEHKIKTEPFSEADREFLKGVIDFDNLPDDYGYARALARREKRKKEEREKKEGEKKKS